MGCDQLDLCGLAKLERPLMSPVMPIESTGRLVLPEGIRLTVSNFRSFFFPKYA